MRRWGHGKGQACRLGNFNDFERGKGSANDLHLGGGDGELVREKLQQFGRSAAIFRRRRDVNHHMAAEDLAPRGRLGARMNLELEDEIASFPAIKRIRIHAKAVVVAGIA